MKISRKILLISLAFILLISSFMVYFNRQPERQIPAGRTIVSPASGKIISIQKIEEPDISFFKKDILNTLSSNYLEPPYKVIIIQLDLFDVHVQRSPIVGTVLDQRYFSGQFKNAVFGPNKNELVNVNEKMLTVIRGSDFSVGVVQVAGSIARRIKSFVRLDQQLQAGELLGRITLGSQVVLILPVDLNLQVSEGQKIIDGVTIMAEY